MSSANVIGVLAEALEVDEEQLSPDTNLEDIDSYDSAGVLAIIACMDKRLGLHLDTQALVNCQTVGDLLAVITKTA